MDILTESSILTCKEYGKAKVYLINQDLFPVTSNEQLTLLDEQAGVRKVEFDGLASGLKELQAKLKAASLGETNEAIEKKIEAAKEAKAKL